MLGTEADPQGRRVLYAEAAYGPEEIAAVLEVLSDRPLTLMTGPAVKEFEERVAQLFGKTHGVMVNSGSSANLVAIGGLDLPAGTEVITPALTFSTTVAPVVQCGLVPAFVDVEPDTFTVDAAQVEAMVGPATRAMMIPNLIGNLPDWQALREIADRHDLTVVEDSADTIGSLYEGSPSGSLTEISTTSFYASHVITAAGFGGMVCTDRADLVERAHLLRGWGRSSSAMGESERPEDRFSAVVDGIPYDAKFVFTALGYNFLPSELSAAFGLVQLERLEGYIESRIRHFRDLLEFFAGYERWLVLPRQRANTHTAWLALPLIIRDSAPFTRRELQVEFETQGIQTRTVFTGNILRQPGFRDIPRRQRDEGYPNADLVMRGGLLIGVHQALTPVQLEHVKETFRRFADKYASA